MEQNNTNVEVTHIDWFTKYFLDLFSMFRTNIRDYGMYIALIVIFIIFSLMTSGVFLGPINFTNLLNQTAYVSVLAVGMTLVIVTRHIDLSVGYIGAFMGAFVVVAVENQGWPVILALVAALVITIVVGIIKGYFVASLKVPAFVVTLAGMFIFKGFLMIRTNNRTIPTSNNFFEQLGRGYLPTVEVAGFDIMTLIVGVFMVGLVIFLGIMNRNKNDRLSIPNEKVSLFVTKLAILTLVIGYLAFTFSSNRGISYLLLVTVVVVAIYHFMTTKTTLGRRIYAVGGNPEAAELSGINVGNIFIIVFVSMGILAMISGVMYVSRLQNTSPNHGPFWELYAIAAAFIGGTSAAGGTGKIVNAVIGSIVIMSLKNGMALAGIDANIEPIVLGSVLLLAVVFDIFTRNVRPIDYVGIVTARRIHRPDLMAARAELRIARENLQAAKLEEDGSIIEFEYALTNAQGKVNKILDYIRVSNEDDFNELIEAEKKLKVTERELKVARSNEKEEQQVIADLENTIQALHERIPEIIYQLRIFNTELVDE